MRVDKKNLRRLASLSAVGAGAVFVTADQAEAGTIVYSGPLDLNVGWSAAFHAASNVQTIVPGFGFRFGTLQRTSSSGLKGGRAVVAYGLGGLGFAVGSYQLRLFGAGAAWGNSLTGRSSLIPQNVRYWWTLSGSGQHYAFGDGTFTDQYALFQFDPGTGPLYGWVELSGALTDAYGPDPSFGPSLTIEGWAYDTSGAPIVAGDTGAAPEPGSFALTGLAALVLGAVGTRRWRAARKVRACAEVR